MGSTVAHWAGYVRSHERFSAIRDDIRDHGLRSPLAVRSGTLMDGAHRAVACLDLGVEYVGIVADPQLP
jgi:ParB-like chromosome segregation protein Spo0J